MSSRRRGRGCSRCPRTPSSRSSSVPYAGQGHLGALRPQSLLDPAGGDGRPTADARRLGDHGAASWTARPRSSLTAAATTATSTSTRPGHEEALLEKKRRARGQTPSARLMAAVPESPGLRAGRLRQGRERRGHRPQAPRGCSTTTGPRRCGRPSSRPSSATRHASPRSPTCSRGAAAPRGAARRCPSTSRAVPTWPTSWSGPTKRRPTMSFPDQTTTKS